MWGVDRFVLTLEAHGDERRETADDEAGGVDQNPFLVHLAGLGDVGLHWQDSRRFGCRHDLFGNSRVAWLVSGNP